jgi:hypothetical protein
MRAPKRSFFEQNMKWIQSKYLFNNIAGYPISENMFFRSHSQIQQKFCGMLCYFILVMAIINSVASGYYKYSTQILHMYSLLLLLLLSLLFQYKKPEAKDYSKPKEGGGWFRHPSRAKRNVYPYKTDVTINKQVVSLNFFFHQNL